MTRKPQYIAEKGSQKWIQEAVNHKPELLETQIREHFLLSNDDSIIWLSPIDKDDYAEYSDHSFIDLLGIRLSKMPLADFWPARGPQWDALAKSKMGNILLVEAKSHIPELVSTPTRASGQSLKKIKISLDETKKYLNSKTEADWSTSFYQYTNRLAYLYLLRTLNKIPAYMVSVYFLNDKEMNGPESKDEWLGAIALLRSYLGITRNRLSKYTVDIFIDVQDILQQV